jgi:hypothetical protein
MSGGDYVFITQVAAVGVISVEKYGQIQNGRK